MNPSALPLRHVCLSDLHLGATNSLLTSLGNEATATADRSGDCLEPFAQALRSTATRLRGPNLPQLIILGDLLDLGLAPMDRVQQAYARFITAMYPVGEPEVFSHHILFVPGNHDHHLWRMCQDRTLLTSLSGVYATPLRTPETATPLLCPYLTGLTRTFTQCADAQVEVVYPNLGLFDDEGRRGLLMHHGHYLDSIYRLMSSLGEAVLGTPSIPASMADIERQNGPWVDFLWSELGAAGASGQAVRTLYEVLCDSQASRRFALQLGQAVVKRMGSLGVAADTSLYQGVTVGQIQQGIIDCTLGRAAESDRYAESMFSTPDSLTALRAYIGGPLLNELRAAGLTSQPAEMGFIYGHTHKPFQDELVVPGYELPVAVYNTGGWVMDRPTLNPLQGASALFIDEGLNVGTLRLFNDAPNDDAKAPRVAGLGGFRDLSNPLLTPLAQAVELDQKRWRDFGQAAQAAIAARATTWMSSNRFTEEHA